MSRLISLLIFVLFTVPVFGQISGFVSNGTEAIVGASIYIPTLKTGTISSENGSFVLDDIPLGDHQLVVSYVGFLSQKLSFFKTDDEINLGDIILQPDSSLKEIIISGNLKPVNRLQSTIPVEVYAPEFLKQNPTPSLFEGIQFINGIRPQINCSICNTGDIHINGLEGPYTFILIDGMPIVSSLGSVYGLNGIPTGMIEKIEIIKGPAGTLYGSQALGGIINVITKLPENNPTIFTDLYGTSWQELNLDLGFSGKIATPIDYFVGINTFIYDQPIDNNDDNFTDVTLQKRFSVFSKFNWRENNAQKGSFALRYLYEDRWGGQMNWTSAFRGSDRVYGESIYTSRFELIGNQFLSPSWEVQYSFTDHQQNSFYGDTSFEAHESIGFLQAVFRKNAGINQWVTGISARYTDYDDNTPATSQNNQDNRWLPGLFVEDEISLFETHKLLLGMRLDYHTVHGLIETPRIGYKINFDEQSLIRLNFGTGFRVVNIFTEDHAALTGARELILEDDLQPEKSYNVNLNFYKKFYQSKGWIFGLDLSLWHTYFSNQILPDYDSNPTQIRYANLDGYGVSQGLSMNLELTYGTARGQFGISRLDVFTQTDQGKIRPVFTEEWSATWALNFSLFDEKIRLDYTGNIYGTMRLPVLGKQDPRAEFSPIWSIQNIKLNYQKNNLWNFFLGVKNLLDWTPAKNNPFLIARSEDPFNQNVVFDSIGNIQPTDNNPYALSFDPTYIYAPNQGIRFFIGLNYSLSK